MEKQIFGLSGEAKAMIRTGLTGGIFMSAIMTYWAIFHMPTDKKQLGPFYFLLFMSYGTTVFMVCTLRVFNTYIEVTDAHIAKYSSNKAPQIFEWTSIESAKNNKTMQRLEVFSISRHERMDVGYEIENIEELLRIIESKTNSLVS